MEQPPRTTFLPEDLPTSQDIQALPDLKKTPGPIIIFGSNDVNDNTLFLNGLTQNIVILYELFESLGYTSYLLQAPSTAEKRTFLRTYRSMTQQDLITQQLKVNLFLEIGMSIDPPTRQYLRSTGTKIAKLYLGNILNIDIETIQAYPSMFFNHHIVGELDEIWTSPHYLQHIDYAAIINRTDPATSRIVPYVWDPCFLTRYGSKDTIEWQESDKKDIVIMDPNISFQKCTFYSLLLADAYARQHPEWKGHVHIINGDRLTLCSHSQMQLLPHLHLQTTQRLHLYGRKRIHEILQEHRSACFITHQWNNDYNYMTLELLYANYPILHNSVGWKPYGYYYDINDWSNSIQTLHHALTQHQQTLPRYKVHAAHLIHKHSIYHPHVRTRWKQILDETTS